MTSLKQMCGMVDSLVTDGTTCEFESSSEFWQKLRNDPVVAQMYTECLIYKYIALTFGLGRCPLFSTLSQIKNISTTDSPSKKATIIHSPEPGSSPRGSLTSSNSASKIKRSSGNYDPRTPEAKSTPKKKYNIIRRKSEDIKKSGKKHHDLDANYDSTRRKSNRVGSKANNTNEAPEEPDKPDERLQNDLGNILISLTYMSKMCDLTEWDFTKLREVFLTWNKARGWDQNASDYEYSVMKKFSMSPTNYGSNLDQNTKVVGDILNSIRKVTGEMAITRNRNVGESIKYWELRHKILIRPEEALSVVKCLILVAKKVLEDGDESKILPILHLFCETIIMCPHTPLELLQECYSTFELFYVWPRFVAHPVKEVLDMIQLEMKCPGHYFRMIFFQDNEITLAHNLTAKMPNSESHVFIDEDIPDTAAISVALGKLEGSRSASSKSSEKAGKLRYAISHIFESVFGSECCDLATLELALQACPVEAVPDVCYEALALMEQASTMSTHGEAQDFLRSELETFSEKLVDFLEAETEDKSTDSIESEPEKNSLTVRPPSTRRVSVLFDNCRLRDPGSPARTIGQDATASPRRNNSYLRRTSSGTLDNTKITKKPSLRNSQCRSMVPAELIGTRVRMNTFNYADISETLFELVRKTAKDFVQEKKKGVRLSFSRKRDSSHFESSQDALRDSGVIDDDYTSTPTETQGIPRSNTLPSSAKNLVTAVRNLRIEEGIKENAPPVKLRQRKEKLSVSTSSSADDHESEYNRPDTTDNGNDSDSFWKEFSENGFSSSENLDLEELLSSMTIDQRKSFLLEKERRKSIAIELKMKENGTPKSPTTEESLPSITGIQIDIESPIEATASEPPPVIRRTLLNNENKRMNRISQLRMKGMRLVRHKRKSTKKSKHEGEHQDKISSAESLSSVSSTPSSTTSEELNDAPTPHRTRTTSEPIYRKKKRRWNRDTLSSSPLVSKNKRDTLSVDVTPRFSLSVRSLPSRERVSLFASDAFIEGRLVSPLPEDDDCSKECDNCRVPKDSFLHKANSPNKESFEDCQEEDKPRSPRKTTFQIGDDEADDARKRIDSGIGQESIKDTSRRRTISSINTKYEQEDLGIGGVKFALKETLRASRRNRMSVSDFEERTVQKKILKLIFVGNDRTLSHVARAYYELRKRQTSRAPLFQHVDLRIYFIPVSSNQLAVRDELVPVESNCGPCDVRVGELLGTFDSWYHTVVMLSVNNLLRVYPKIFSYGDTFDESGNSSGGEKLYAKPKLLAPQEVIASSLLSYSRFAVSITNINMYKVVMVTSTGDILTDIFCCRLQAGHDAYTKAVKAGRFGKMGKLVDLSDDSGPPPAYTRIEYSKWSIDGTLIYTGKLDDTFYHTVSVTPMSLMKESYRGRDVLHLFILDNEKKLKAGRRSSSSRLNIMEDSEHSGNVLNVGTMKMEVSRPSQGTFALVLDDTKIYTSIKSIEIIPCPAPETEMLDERKLNTPRRREQNLMRLPVRTFWPATK